ncbi:MAG: hypothetical protein RIT35_204 [Pseudomonadota bacterium]
MLKIKSVLIGLFLTAIQFNQIVLAMDLTAAYELALRNDPLYRSAVKEYEAGMEFKNIGRSSLLPKAYANYNTASNRATQWGQQFPGGPDISYNWSYPSDFAAAQITQPLFSLDALARWKQGIAQSDYSQSKFIYSTQDLLVRVSQAYVDLLFSIDQYRYLTIESEAFLEQTKATSNLFVRGEGPRTSVLESQAAYQVSLAKLVDAKDMIENARRKLNSMVGGNLGEASQLVPLKNDFKLITIVPQAFEDWAARAEASNSELKSMKDQIEVAYQEYRKNDANHYPVVNLVAAVTTQSSNTVSSINQTTNQNYVGVQLSLPLFLGGETKSKSAQSFANYEKAKADYQVAYDRIITDLRKQYDLVQSGWKKIQALQSAQESSELLVKAMRKSVQSGERINLDILLAQKGLFLTSRDLSQAKYGYLIAYLKLFQLGGSLDPIDFNQVALYFKN